MAYYESRLAIMAEIQREIDAGQRKHGHSIEGDKRSPERKACILAEEAGEVVKATLEATQPGAALPFKEDALHELRKELVQTAAVAIRLLESWSILECQIKSSW